MEYLLSALGRDIESLSDEEQIGGLMIVKFFHQIDDFHKTYLKSK